MHQLNTLFLTIHGETGLQLEVFTGKKANTTTNRLHTDTMSSVHLEDLSPYLGTWDKYIIDMLTSGHVKDAAIFDLRGQLLSASEGLFSVTVDEYVCIINRIANTVNRKDISVNGESYKVHLADGVRAIMAKNRDGRGCTVAKTGRLLLIGVHDHTMNPDMCNDVIMRLYDFFIQKTL